MKKQYSPPENGQFIVVWKVNGKLWSETLKWVGKQLLYYQAGHWRLIPDSDGYFEQLEGAETIFIV